MMKRPRHEKEGDSDALREALQHAVTEVEYYKEKLIILARAHAALLTLVERDEYGNIVGRNRKGYGSDEDGEDIDEDEGVEALLSKSQLTEDEEGRDELIEDSQNTVSTLAMSEPLLSPPLPQAPPVTASDAAVDANVNGQEGGYCVRFDSVIGTNEGERMSASQEQRRPSSPLLERWGSLASHKTAFADFINESGDVLGSLPEVEAWLDLAGASVIGDENGEDNTQDALEKAGLLPKNFGEDPWKSSVALREGETENGQTKDQQRVHSDAVAPAHVRVGVGVLVKDPNHPDKVFAGIRKGSHGAGSLALPGGHLEMNESWEQCAAREVEEETGLRIRNVTFAHVTNDPMPASEKHYITLFMKAECVDRGARPQNLEPHKCEGWSSYSWKELRDILNLKRNDVRLFGPLKHLVEDEPCSVLQFLEA